MAVKTKDIPEQQPTTDGQNHLNRAATRAYSGQKKQLVSNEQISDLLPMVHKIVRQVVTYLRPPLSFEDLVSAGTVGLVKAAHEFDPSHHAGSKHTLTSESKGRFWMN